MSDDIMYDSKEDCYMVPEERFEEMEKAVAERDELAAELERVKAERDDARQSADTQCQIRYMVDEELSSLKSRLPVNADGDVVLWGDEVWGMSFKKNPFKIVVEEIEKRVSERDGKEFFELKGKNGSGGACRLHSTAESCRAANTQEGE